MPVTFCEYFEFIECERKGAGAADSAEEKARANSEKLLGAQLIFFRGLLAWQLLDRASAVVVVW